MGLWDRVRMSPGSMDTYLNNKIRNTTPLPSNVQINVNPEYEMFNQLEKTFDINIDHLYQLANIANKIAKQTDIHEYTDGLLSYTNNKV